jgi:hypothetical protein
MTYRCPVCRKPLTRNEYEKALGILGEREQHLKHEKAELAKKLRVAAARAEKARKEGINFERARTQRLLRGKDKTIASLKERIDQLKKGSTPQTEGLEFEEKLAARLKREFPGDDVQHKGKGGDVLHIVKHEGKAAGLIIYECKRTGRIQGDHLAQAFAAKQSRKADFCVLVTTGQKKGFSGLALMKSVLVVSPLGAIPLAMLLRVHLIEMLRTQIGTAQRALVARRLLDLITSPQFKNPIEEVIEVSTQLQDMIKDEAKSHFRIWEKRWKHYQTIQWDSSLIQENIHSVLHGKEPKAIQHPKMKPLQLPASIAQA